MSLKLTPENRRIIAEVTWDARAPFEEIARKLRVKAHTVRRTMRLWQDAFDLRPVCFTHPYRLGQVPFRVFFRISGASAQRMQEFESFVSSIPEVSWFVSLIGLYQYCFTIRAEGHLHFLELCGRIDQRFGDIIATKNVCTVTHLSCYSPSLSHGKGEPRKCFAYSASPDRLDLSPLDHKILNFLRDKPLATMQEVGRATGTSTSTVDYRFNRLIQSGAIIAFGYAYEWSNFGNSEFLVSISTKGFGSRCYDNIASFCARHGGVEWLGRFIGPWDIELSVSVREGRELENFIHELHDACRGQVAEVHIHTFSRLHHER